MEYTQEQIEEALRIVAAVEADKAAKLAAAKAAKEEENRKVVAEAAEIVEHIRNLFDRLKQLNKGRNLRLNLFDIHSMAQDMDTETDWNSSSLYC